MYQTLHVGRDGAGDTVVLASGPDDAADQGAVVKWWPGHSWWTRCKAWWWVGRNQARFS